jgi:repressor LexA
VVILDKLTKKQEEILNYVLEEIANGNYPTYREIMYALHYSSVSTVFQHIKKLESLGYLISDKKARSLRSTRNQFHGFPILGAVHAGSPTIAVEEIQGFLPLPIDQRAHPNAFLLRVKGDSMIGAHIEEGDLVVVDPDTTPVEGDICVAVIGEEATVKKIEKRRNGFYLVPENPHYIPIFITNDTKIIGKVIGLWRSRF